MKKQHMGKEQQGYSPAHLLLMNKMEKEIYENITQIICLAKMRIQGVDCEKREDALERIDEVNILLGKAVCDLRNLAKEFHKLNH